MRTTIINKIKRFAELDDNVFLVTGDAGYGVLDEYKKSFPDRYLNMGVAEQNMTSFAAGLSLTNYKVFLYNIIPFLLYRCYEQLRNDICYQGLPVTLIGIGSGVTYAPQGVTHYSVEDIELARTLPNLIILSPADPTEAALCAEYAYHSNRPVYIRVAKSGEPAIHNCSPASIEEPIIVRKGEDVAVLFHGSISCEVIKAVESLGKQPAVISVPMIQPLNTDFLIKNLANIHTLITVEEHFIDGGLGSVISDWLTRENLKIKLIKLGIKNEFIDVVKNTEGMRKHYGISFDNIRITIEEIMNHG